MAATAADRLFSLELLVDWVRLEAGPPARAPAPALAFCLLDLPPLLVRPPAAPAPPAASAAPGGAIGFGRGKACVFRLPRAPRRPMLRAALLLPPAGPAPAAPRLLGACAIPLAARGRRATFALRGAEGERVADLALFCRLTELRPGGAEGPAAGAPAQDAGARAQDAGAREEDAGAGPTPREAAEVDWETNTIRPPPLCYTRATRERTPPPPAAITIEPQSSAPEELDGAFPEAELVKPPAHPSLLKHATSVTQESPPVVVSHPHAQDAGAVNQATCHPQVEQSAISTLRQLPLLNALLIELSLLYNQPVATPTQVHPHLAWLYRTEDRPPESSARSTSQSESKKQLSVGERERSVSLQCKKNQVESHKKGKHFEKNCGSPPKRITKGRLLYGLTNTLRLRLKQTNPDMLVVHEKREQYRKMQAQTGAKFRIPSCKVKGLSFAEERQKPHQLSKDNQLDLDESFAQSSDTSRQISGVFGEPSTTKTKLKQATEKETVGGETRISHTLLETIVNSANSIFPERCTPTNHLGGKLEMKVQSPCEFQQDTVVDRVVDKGIDDGQDSTTDSDIFTADMGENRPSKNSYYESISELKYSDDFTSPCCSEDFSTTEDTSRSFPALDGSPGARNPKRSPSISKSSEVSLSMRKNGSEESFVLSPPFSAGSPVHSNRRSQVSKTRDKSLEDAPSVSASDLCSRGTEEKENQIGQTSMCNSKAVKRGQDIPIKTGTGCKSSEKSQSGRTSQVSSYLPSNLSELELKVLDSSPSDDFDDEGDDIGSLSISKQCKDICELVINKLPGYTV